MLITQSGRCSLVQGILEYQEERKADDGIQKFLLLDGRKVERKDWINEWHGLEEKRERGRRRRKDISDTRHGPIIHSFSFLPFSFFFFPFLPFPHDLYPSLTHMLFPPPPPSSPSSVRHVFIPSIILFPKQHNKMFARQVRVADNNWCQGPTILSCLPQVI